MRCILLTALTLLVGCGQAIPPPPVPPAKCLDLCVRRRLAFLRTYGEADVQEAYASCGQSEATVACCSSADGTEICPTYQ